MKRAEHPLPAYTPILKASKPWKHKANAYKLNPINHAGISIAQVLSPDPNGPVDRMREKGHDAFPFNEAIYAIDFISLAQKRY